MKPINEMSLKDCLDLLRKKRMPIVMADGKVFHGMFDHQDRIDIADRIHDLTRWIPVEERFPDVGDVLSNKKSRLVYSDCGRYLKLIEQPEKV